MSLNGALHVGRTALLTSQAAMQVAGNNMANAATEGFHRRTVHLSPLSGEVVGRGHLVGRGVQIDAIRREVDAALQARYRDALGEEHAASGANRFLAAIESLQNELSDNDLSSLLGEFFNSFSELSNNPSDNAVRAVVIQQGVSLSGRIADLRRDYGAVLGDLDRQLGTAVENANDLLDRIAGLNAQIVQSENGVGEASALRDQRDLLIDELATFVDLNVIEHESGSLDILVNSIPVLLAGRSRGMELRKQTVDGELEVTLRVAEDGTHLDARSGLIGGLLEQRADGKTVPAIQTLEDFTSQLVFQVNRLHSQGQGQKGFTAVTGTYAVNDSTVNLNAGDAGLPWRIENGSFFVHVTHRDTGQRTSHRIDVDGDAMSLDDLIAEINVAVGVPNVTAGIDASRHLTLAADPGYEITFSDDASGALAALGVNTFFTGENAASIAVNDVLLDDPSMLAAGAGHVAGSNGTALAIANLEDAAVEDLGGASLRGFWQNAVNGLAVQTASSGAALEASRIVRENLSTQLQAITGVSLDEESINLIMFQRQFQAAARYITVIDEALQVLLSIV